MPAVPKRMTRRKRASSAKRYFSHERPKEELIPPLPSVSKKSLVKKRFKQSAQLITTYGSENEKPLNRTTQILMKKFNRKKKRLGR